MQARLCGTPGVLLMILVTATLVILITGFGRLHTGAHWPADGLDGILWGCTGLVLLATLAVRFLPSQGLASSTGRGLSLSPGPVSARPGRVSGQHAARDRERSDGRVRP